MIKRILPATLIGLIIGIYLGSFIIPIPDLITQYTYGGIVGALLGGLVGAFWGRSSKTKQKKLLTIRIKRSHFRILLIIYVITILIIMLIGSRIDYSNCLDPTEYPSKFAMLTFIMSTIVFFYTVILLISLIGLFLFKNFARYLFIIANIISLLSAPTYSFFKKLLIEEKLTLQCKINYPPVISLVVTLCIILTVFIIIISFTKFGLYLFQNKERKESNLHP